MTHAALKDRLARLLELSVDGPARRGELLSHLADLVLDWPSDCAPSLRPPFEALLAKWASRVGPLTRSRIAQRFTGEESLSLLNQFFLEAPQALRTLIIARNAVLEAPDDCAAMDGTALVEAARAPCDFAETFARSLALPRITAEEILDDDSAQSLAVACKGAGLDRATFSAVAMIMAKGGDSTERLSAYDRVPQNAARRLTQVWQKAA